MKITLAQDNNLNKDSRPLDFLNLIILSLSAQVLEKVTPNLKPTNFPKTVGEFRFVNTFTKETEVEPFFKYAIYQDKQGRIAMAKLWQGKFKNLPYFTLKNEINTYSILNTVYERVKSQLPKKISNVQIPKLYLSAEDENSLLALFEFIQNSTNANDLPLNKKVDIYFNVVKYLTFLGTKLTQTEKAQISTRTPQNHLILFPFLLLNAIKMRPSFILKLLLASQVILKSIHQFLNDGRLVLSHRDLKFKNILVKDNKTYLIDLEYCVFTHPYYEFANSLSSYWKVDNFEKLFFTKLKKNYKKVHKNQGIFKSFLVITTIHYLIDKHLKKESVLSYFDCLVFARKGTI